jgi:hypothetical protein
MNVTLPDLLFVIAAICAGVAAALARTQPVWSGRFTNFAIALVAIGLALAT